MLGTSLSLSSACLAKFGTKIFKLGISELGAEIPQNSASLNYVVTYRAQAQQQGLPNVQQKARCTAR
ncbi:hypothetical protein U1Q18_010415, partial [Sarracenia purpurea var. burkii]